MSNERLEELYNNLESARGGMNTDDIEKAIADIEDYRLQKLIAGLLAVERLINESGGIWGLHRNGNNSPWGELRTGGRFENWLYEFDDALELISKIKHAGGGGND